MNVANHAPLQEITNKQSKATPPPLKAEFMAVTFNEHMRQLHINIFCCGLASGPGTSLFGTGKNPGICFHVLESHWEYI